MSFQGIAAARKRRDQVRRIHCADSHDRTDAAGKRNALGAVASRGDDSNSFGNCIVDGSSEFRKERVAIGGVPNRRRAEAHADDVDRSVVGNVVNRCNDVAEMAAAINVKHFRCENRRVGSNSLRQKSIGSRGSADSIRRDYAGDVGAVAVVVEKIGTTGNEAFAAGNRISQFRMGIVHSRVENCDGSSCAGNGRRFGPDVVRADLKICIQVQCVCFRIRQDRDCAEIRRVRTLQRLCFSERVDGYAALGKKHLQIR